MRQIVRECEQCSRTEELPKEPKTGSIVEQIEHPNEKWMGKCCFFINIFRFEIYARDEGHTYLVNIIDVYTRFAFGDAIKQKDSDSVLQVFRKYVCIYCTPAELQTVRVLNLP